MFFYRTKSIIRTRRSKPTLWTKKGKQEEPIEFNNHPQNKKNNPIDCSKSDTKKHSALYGDGLSPPLAPPGQNSSSCLGRHSFSKTVSTFPLFIVRLVCPFHKIALLFSRQKYTLLYKNTNYLDVFIISKKYLYSLT